MNTDELLRALFSWCLENSLPELKAFSTQGGETVAMYYWSMKHGGGYLEVWLDPAKWVLTYEYSWDEWDSDCNAMGRPSTGQSVQIETVEQLQSALWHAFK